ncbi:MAG: DNA/RNA non-specific endonuclease [Prevotella sp.]|nr:DNA/RNA non-specific endonuclease [Prevotella sp.]
MKNLRYLMLIMLAGTMLTACNDDDKIAEAAPPSAAGGPSDTNTNANYTNEDTAFGNYECPAIQVGDNFVRLIRRTSSYGITYMIEYDKSKRSQRWTCFQMNNTNSVKNWARKNWEGTTWGGDPFQPDPDLPTSARTELEDYRGSGYQRGHICASEDRVMSQAANEQTFYLSNIMPQLGSLNTGVWGDMEIFLRNTWNNRNFRDVLYIVKGGTIRDDQIREIQNNRLVVPKYFYMAVVCERGTQYKGLAFWAEHDKGSAAIRDCIISIDELESRTGIDFFCNLPDNIENAIEAKTTLGEWGL